jgi:hypothetical protein
VRMMGDRYALESVRPRTWKDKRSLLVFGGIILATILLVFGLNKVVRSSQRAREQHWINARGTVEDVRGGAVVGQNGGYRSAMLYKEEVLVTYSVSGLNQKRWVVIGAARQQNIGFDSVRLKGRHCLVLINPKNPEQVQVELSRY